MTDAPGSLPLPDAFPSAQAFMDAFAKNVGGLVSFVDVHGHVQYASEALAEWMGTTREAIHGQALREIYGDAAYSQFEPWTNRALAGEDVHYERQALRNDGTSRWLSVNLRPHRDARSR